MKAFHRATLFCLILAVSFLCGADATDRSFRSDFFDARTTGGAETFWSVAQDERGIMYFGCETLVTFDGERWKRHDLGDTYEIRSLSVGAEGRVWIGAMNELGYCDRTVTGEVGRYHSLRAFLPDPAVNLGEIWHVFARGTGAVFVTRSLVLIWNGEKFQINELPGGRRLSAMQIAGEIYVTHRHRGIWHLVEDKLVPFISEAALGGTDIGIDGLTKSGSDWLIVTTKGLLRSDTRQSALVNSSASEFFQKHPPTGTCTLHDGRICVATVGGVVVLSESGDLLQVIDHDDQLGPITAMCAFTAKDGAVWVATASGLLRLVLNDHTRIFGPKQGLQGERCGGIAEIGSSIYVATLNGIFVCDKTETPVLFRPFVASESLPFFDIAAVNNKPYAAGYRGIYTNLDAVMKPVRVLNQDPVIVREVSAGVLIANDGTDLVRLNMSQPGPAIRIAQLPDAPQSISQDPGGRIWLGMRAHGILQVEPGAKVTQFESEGIRGNRCLATQLGNRLAVCSSAGIAVFVSQSKEYKMVEGAPETVPLAISNVDANKSVWIAFSSPFRSEPKTVIVGRLVIDDAGNGRWSHYAAEGLERLGNINAIFADSEGSVWISGSEGVAQIRPSAIPLVTAPLPPTVTGSLAPNGAITFSRGGTGFELSTTEYGRRSALRFQTKLSPLNDQWSEPTNDPYIPLTGLRDGSYEFAARVVNDAGMISPATTWPFRVLPPWYRTKTAYGAWSALLAAAVFGLVQWRSSYLRQQNLRLEALVRKKTEQLEKANQAKTDFIADMSHEIRNPISGIVGLSLAMEETSLDERQRQLTDSIRSCASLLATLVDDVLDFSKIEAGKIDLRVAPFDVQSILEQCAAMVAEDARRANADLRIAVETDVPPRLIGDAARIQQIILNYLTNAVKFASAGAITVGVSRLSPERVRFYVRDQGPGMSETEAAQLFTKFARLEKARANNVRGSGLGLAVCRFLADKMGGSVGVNSKIGDGSCFWAELPLPVASDQPARTTTPAPSGPPLRALIVEDIDYNAAAMQAVLRKLGVQSDVVTDGPSALEQLQQTFYDVAFMDWNLPGMIGTEVVSRFRAVESPQRRTIIIATTAYSAEFNREACLKAGMDAFIGKPLTPEKIAAALRDLRGSLRSAISVEVSRQPEPTKVPPTNNGQIDLQMLRFLGDNTPEGLSEQITRYLASFEKDREALSTTMKTGDAQVIHRIAHRLASHASMVRYEPLRELAATLQSRAATSKREELSELFAAFDREFAAFRKKLDSILSSAGSA